MRVGFPAERIEVDFMPTIGEEQYDDTDRVPLRDVRALFAQFERFDGRLIGVANEQSLLYQRSMHGLVGTLTGLDLACLHLN